MPDNSRKTPLSGRLNRFAEGKIRDALQLTGRALPASVVSRTNMIVKVKFEVVSGFTLPVVTMPLASSEYVRAAIRPGCKGVVFPADTYIGGMSGLGGGVADLTQRANLSTLVFFPIGNTGMQVEDASKTVLYGEPSVLLKDKGGNSIIELTPTGITMSFGAHSILINASGVIIDGHEFISHIHGNGNAGAPTTGVI